VRTLVALQRIGPRLVQAAGDRLAAADGGVDPARRVLLRAVALEVVGIRDDDFVLRGKRGREQRHDQREDNGDPITHLIFPFGLVWQPAIVSVALRAVPAVAVMVRSSCLRPAHDTVTTNDEEMAPSGTMTE